MNALPNAHNPQVIVKPPCIGLTSSGLPEAQSSHTGVSSDYTPKVGHQWYVLRVTYNRVQAAQKRIDRAGVQTYQPMHYVVEKDKIGKKKRIQKPLLPNLVFVYATREEVNMIVGQRDNGLSVIKFYLDKTQPLESNGHHPPMTIPYDAMQNFIRVTSTQSEHVRIVTPSQCKYKSGDLVRIIAGEFEGTIGKVARIAGQQRVVVEITGLCLVATAYVPAEFIEFCLKE